MKYAGVINIIDDEGNIVFEKELSEDEIVETLIAEIPDEAEGEQEDSAAKPSKVAEGAPSEVRACCGAMTRGRHKKGCPDRVVAGSPERRRTIDNRQPFSQPTYDVVKTLLEKDGETVDGVSAEKGLDLDEVRRVNLSDDFDDYLAIA